jgi:glutamate-1-semialdehyde 2,1-aminomutase
MTSSELVANPIAAEYVRRTPRSAALGPRAERVMPGGDTRAAGYHPPYPLTLARGEGAKVWDVDGNQYWDLSCNYTSLVHGHGFAPIVDAARRAIETGTAWPARNLHQIELAELLCDRIESVERVRFCNSGSEANMLALHVARIATGRPKILMARFGYHGSHEYFEAGTGRSQAHVPGADATLTASYGDIASFESVLRDHGDQIAAVFVEAVMGAGGVVSAPPAFFAQLLEATHRAGAVLVLDEVITLRLAAGGHQRTLGVRPDLTTFAKIIGGGFAVGAVGGRQDLMSLLDPRANRMFHSGTFNGNPVTCAAGVAAMSHLTADRIGALDQLGERLAHGLTAAAANARLPFSLRRAGSLLNLYLLAQPPVANPLRGDTVAIALLHLAGMNHGLYFAPRGMLALSTPLDDTAVDDIVARFAAAFDAVRPHLASPAASEAR